MKTSTSGIVPVMPSISRKACISADSELAVEFDSAGGRVIAVAPKRFATSSISDESDET